MRLHMADIHLYRARLFHAVEALSVEQTSGWDGAWAEG